ncbi:NAD(P)-dependent oxidoreductase [Streptacidiphilus sp. P02-A3a]|uniref:NAD(P)-dependent oxidoreductase n=1 Tax=Streptacidiphilus sp. P02-A3a TaxID=2704468 RepID=UPI0015FAE6D6|nr:NAD(P)H-binding protein [Streptacidiphilus sp. P02-A3a]QMU73341.1 NAD(P)H-binding protein [Streptacidiphilus sp. P02-A3a]
MDLTVFGATGGIGGRLVRQALAAGHTVTAVVRDASRFDPGADADRAGLRVVVVPDLAAPGVLPPVVAGRDAVLSALGPTGRKQVGIATAGTGAILDAMAATGVGRIVVVSAAPVGPVSPDDGLLQRAVAYPLLRAILKDVYADLARMEQLLHAGGTAWTALRPPRLTDGPLTGHYRTAVGGPVANGRTISRADAAHAMLAALDAPETYKQPLGIAY